MIFRTRFLQYLVVAMFSISFFPALSSCFYSSKASQRLLDKAAATTYDVVVIPGVPFEDGKWDRTMKGRVYWGKYLYDRGIAKNLMFSGSAVYTPYYEALIMANYAIALGIPKEHVFWEIRAEHSTENIYYSYYKAKRLGFNTVALASDRFQTRTLKRFIRRKVDPAVGLIPMVTDTLRMLEPTMIDPVIDSENAYAEDFISIKKRESFFKRMRGTLGLNLIKDSLDVRNK